MIQVKFRIFYTINHLNARYYLHINAVRGLKNFS